MKVTKLLMGMPVTVEVVDKDVTFIDVEKVYDYFVYVDKKFSTYKPGSEISKFNNGSIKESEFSEDMAEIFKLAEETNKLTGGYFDILHRGKYDPSGIVKGWAINNAAKILKRAGFKNYYVDAGGDIEVSGKNGDGEKWSVGIRNPFNPEEIVKVLEVSDVGVATSGTYERGQHVYNPVSKTDEIHDIMSITVVAGNIYEADRFATAAFAMGKTGIEFIGGLKGFEGYVIDVHGQATYTSNFEKYVKK